MMNSKIAGKNILDVEITNISSHGIWLYTENQEFFMSYNDFPWFQDAAIRDILFVEQQSPGHFYWPNLDVDLSIEIIRNPERFPLQAIRQ